MRRAAALLLAAALFGPAVQAAPQSLYDAYRGKTVRVYVSPVTNSGGQEKVEPAALRSGIEEALRNRKSTHFVLVSAPEEAELVIEADIRDFMWTDHDPIDMITGISGTAADAILVEDYAKLIAEVTIKNERQKVLWQDTLRATITKKPMSEAESVPLIIEDFANVLIRKCFGKQ